MRIEFLFPEVAGLYGEHANVTYLARSSENSEVIDTGLKDKPAFIDPENKIDFVYMGSMAESAQLLVMDALEPYKDAIFESIENGQMMLFTGNAHEVFGNKIVDLDEMPYDAVSFRVDAANKETKCLGIFKAVAYREMLHRYSCLFLGNYGELEVTGSKSTFTYSEYDDERLSPLFTTQKGPGLDKKDGSPEGYRYKNYMATYLIAPLFPTNPLLMKALAAEAGFNIKPCMEEAAVEAYRARLEEFKSPKRNFVYGH